MSAAATGPLAGRVALVTGSSRGVGADIARRLAHDGARVAINYRLDEQAATATADDIAADGGLARTYRCSVDDPDGVRAMLAAIGADLGTVDLFVSNAGVASRGDTIGSTSTQEYLRLLRTHALGPLDLLTALLPGMRSAGRSDIIAVSSVATTLCPPNGGAYTVAKAAMEAAIRTLAFEERAHGVRANIVAPGLVATDMGEKLAGAVLGRSIGDLDPSFPFGRVARGHDVAAVVAFLAGTDAEYLTGQRIAVDGGGPATSLLV